jgi:CheY-like chemotaxis protein
MISMKSILIIDDDQLVLDVVSDTIGAAGYVTKTAHSLDEAISLLETSIFDLIMLDWHLGSNSGQEVLDYIKEAGIATPVSILSSDDRLDTVNTAMVHGAVDFLSKADSDPAEVLAHVRDRVGA